MKCPECGELWFDADDDYSIEPCGRCDHEAFLSRWTQIKRGGVPIARCLRCGFECFAGADASIEEHDKACTRKPQP